MILNDKCMKYIKILFDLVLYLNISREKLKLRN